LDGGALQANSIVQLFWNTSGVNINQLYSPSANIGSLTVSNLNISGSSIPWKTSSWSMYGTPNTLTGSGAYTISQGYYDSHSDVNGGSILPIGIAGYNNNSNTSNCYIQYTGYFSNNSSISVAPGHTITPTTSTFSFSFGLNSALGTQITAYNPAGYPATMSITSYNGEAGGFSTGLSDIICFPSNYIGNNQNRLFLNLYIQDGTTQSAGFVLNSGTAYFF